MGLNHKTWKQELLKGVRIGLVSTAFPVLCCSLASKHACASFTVIHQLVAAVGTATAPEIYVYKSIFKNVFSSCTYDCWICFELL